MGILEVELSFIKYNDLEGVSFYTLFLLNSHS